jgi:chromosome segregation ATPase
VFGYTTNRQLQQQLINLTAKVEKIMSQQDNIAADVATIEAGIAAIQSADAALATAQQALSAEIASLKAAHPQLDLSGLDKAAADVTAAASANSSAVAGISALPTT